MAGIPLGCSGRTPAPPGRIENAQVGLFLADAGRVAAGLPPSAWQRRSAGAGSKGRRWYDWAWLDQVTTDAHPDDGGHHSLLIRKNTATGELAFYRCWTRQPARPTLRVAGIRWTVEEAFQAARSQVGLAQTPDVGSDLIVLGNVSRNGLRCGAAMPRRRRRARGHIGQLPSGRFRAIVYAGIDPLTRKERYLRETAKTYDATWNPKS